MTTSAATLLVPLRSAAEHHRIAAKVTPSLPQHVIETVPLWGRRLCVPSQQLVVVTTVDGDGHEHEDWVVAATALDALDILADAVVQRWRSRKGPVPNMLHARVNQEQIKSGEISPEELIRLGKGKLTFLEAWITHIDYRYGYECDAAFDYREVK